MATSDKIKLIYIASFSRSGSTLLDSVLGNAPMAFSTGELGRIGSAGWLNNEVCSCGAEHMKCSFWADVYQEWQSSTKATAEEYIALQDRFERARRVFVLIKERKNPSADFLRYQALTLALLSIIREKSGANILIDSTKAPMRALAFSLMPDIDMTLVHLVRDVRAVSWSMFKPYKKDSKAGIERDIKPVSVTKTTLLWSFVNRQIAWTRRQGSVNSVLVRYESFLNKPADIIQDIYIKAGAGPSDIKALSDTLQKSGELSIGPHIVAGNRLRMQGTLRLKTEERWKEDMPVKDQKRAAGLSGLLFKGDGA